MVKLQGLPLLALLVISAVGLSSAYVSYTIWGTNPQQDFYFGVTFGGNTTAQAKLLIDKVKGYTNLFIVDSFDVTGSSTPATLDEICNYASGANLHFIVYFFSFYNSSWNRQWVETATAKWQGKFSGVYLRDEPGGGQLDTPMFLKPVNNSATYAEAANGFVKSISSSFSMQFLKARNIPVFTSDYALFQFDYQAGFDTMFAELGWNNSRTQQIALIRGAANTQGKDWGTIITWTYMQPPYIASPTEIYRDMVNSYDAGAKYVLIFDYPQNDPQSPYGILTTDHFAAMQQFWKYAQSSPRVTSKQAGEVALVLPKDYGWGMRSLNDTIWGLWDPDNASALIWQNMNILIGRYGLKLDIVYDGDCLDLVKAYSQVFLWNQNIS